MIEQAERPQQRGRFTELQSRVRRADPVTGLVMLVALVTYALHGVNGVLSRDLGVYSYAGQQMVDGVPPYEAILNRAGPLAHAIPALGVAAARIGGFDDLLGIRLLFMAIAVVTAGVAYLVGRDMFGSRLAGLATAGALLSFHSLITLAGSGPREKTPMVLFMLLAFWAAARRRWFWAGFFVGLATLTLQIAFFVALPAVAVAVLGVARGERLRALVRVAVGGLVPLVACAIYFALAGALQAFVDGFVLINSRYTTPNPMLPKFDEAWQRLQVGYGFSLWVLLLGLASTIVLGLAALRPERRRGDPAIMLTAACAVGTVCGVAWTLRDFDSWPDSMLLVPMAALGIGALAKAIVAVVSPRVSVGVTAGFLVVALVTALVFSVGHRDDTLVAQRRTVAAVMRQLPADSTMISLAAPQAMVLAGKTNPSRHQMISHDLQEYIDDSWPGGYKGFRAWVKSRDADLIAVNVQAIDNWRDYLKPEYTKIGRAPTWVWMARTSLGERKIAALRRAASAAEERGTGSAPVPVDAGTASR